MPENEENQSEPKKQLCTMMVMFSVITDEEAIAVKKKITDVLSDRTDIQFDFNLRQMPVRPKR